MKQHLPALALVAIATAIAVVACSPKDDPEVAQQVRKQLRAEKNKAKLDAPPQTRTYNLPGGQMVVTEIPGLDTFGVIVENQRCYLWRDAEYKTATLSCPQPPQMDVTP